MHQHLSTCVHVKNSKHWHSGSHTIIWAQRNMAHPGTVTGQMGSAALVAAAALHRKKNKNQYEGIIMKYWERRRRKQQKALKQNFLLNLRHKTTCRHSPPKTTTTPTPPTHPKNTKNTQLPTLQQQTNQNTCIIILSVSVCYPINLSVCLCLSLCLSFSVCVHEMI